MRNIDSKISTFVESQFPDFYRDEGPVFVLFVKEYYKWLETFYSYAELDSIDGFNIGDTVTQSLAQGTIEAISGNFILIKNSNNNLFRCKIYCQDLVPIVSSSGATTFIATISSPSSLFHSRNLFNTKDLDKTADFFLYYFKQKYLKDIQFTSKSSKKNLIKAAHDLFSSKGTARSIDLLFRLVHGSAADVYLPGDDVFKASAGKWVIPYYLEVTSSPKTQTLVGKQITGTRSGATAVVESVITRNIKNKYIDIIYLSNINGNFVVGEIVTNDGIIEGSPKIIGSVSQVNITHSGDGFRVGEVVNLVSETGQGAKAVVKEIKFADGVVTFELVDPGWGYSTTATTIVANKMLGYDIVTGIGFEQSETVVQSLANLTLTNITGYIGKGDTITNLNGDTGIVMITGQVYNSNTGGIIVNNTSGNVSSNSILRVINKQIVAVNTNASFSNDTKVLQYQGANNITTAFIENIQPVMILSINATPVLSSNGLHVGQYISQPTTGAAGIIAAMPYTNYHTYTNVSTIAVRNVTGNFSNTGVISVYANDTTKVISTNATPNAATAGYLLTLKNNRAVTGSNTQWAAGNKITTDTGSNNTIIFAADIGGKTSTSSDITATGNAFFSNSVYIGVVNTNNAFYPTTGNLIRGLSSNTYASINFVSSGGSASMSVASITDTELVAIPPDLALSSKNAVGTNYMSINLRGSNSIMGYISNILVSNGGTGYSNTNKIVFTGGSPTVNATDAGIVTSSNGAIQYVVLSTNPGIGYISAPTLSIVNSTGGSTGVGSGANLAALFPYGFPQAPTLDLINQSLFQLVKPSMLTIGSIENLGNINPGAGYDVPPFVKLIQPEVTPFAIHSKFLKITDTIGDFLLGEKVEQEIVSEALQITSNNMQGGSFYSTDELAYTSDGVNITGQGVVITSIANSGTLTTKLHSVTGNIQPSVVAAKLTVTSNSGFTIGNTVYQGATTGTVLATNSTTLIIKNVVGTFNANNTYITSNTGGNTRISSVQSPFTVYRLTGANSNTTSDIIAANVVYQNTIVKGIITRIIDDSNIEVSLRTLRADFKITDDINNGRIVGRRTNSSAAIEDIKVDMYSSVVGGNALVDSFVTSSNGAIKTVYLINSGLGYVDKQNVQIVSSDKGLHARGNIRVINQGFADGYFDTRDGFVSDTKYIHDGVYYQDYSYEIQSGIPLDKYAEMLKKSLHVAGTKLFGKLKTTSVANVNLTAAYSNITVN